MGKIKIKYVMFFTVFTVNQLFCVENTADGAPLVVQTDIRGDPNDLFDINGTKIPRKILARMFPIANEYGVIDIIKETRFLRRVNLGRNIKYLWILHGYTYITNSEQIWALPPGAVLRLDFSKCDFYLYKRAHDNELIMRRHWIKHGQQPSRNTEWYILLNHHCKPGVESLEGDRSCEEIADFFPFPSQGKPMTSCTMFIKKDASEFTFPLNPNSLRALARSGGDIQTLQDANRILGVFVLRRQTQNGFEGRNSQLALVLSISKPV